MGNSLNFSDSQDSDGPGESFKFFQSIQLGEIKKFFADIRKDLISDFSIDHRLDSLLWKDYFHLFEEIENNSLTEKEKRSKLSWHISTLGYDMVRDGTTINVEEEGQDIDKEDLPDDYTDDDASEENENEDFLGQGDGEAIDHSLKSNDDEHSLDSETKAKKALPREWDSAFTNPIFFGYTLQKSAERENEEILEKANEINAELRAVEKAKESRTRTLRQLEKNVRRLFRISVCSPTYLRLSYSQSIYDR
jgi:hypothetical protein